MRAQLRRDLFPQPMRVPPGLRLTAEHMAEAVVRAAMATGELSQLTYRYEAAIKGMCSLRARWIALAALLSLHPEAEVAVIAGPLGCGPTALRALAKCRGSAWWDEALVHRLFLDLAESADATSIQTQQALRQSVAELLSDRGIPSNTDHGGDA